MMVDLTRIPINYYEKLKEEFEARGFRVRARHTSERVFLDVVRKDRYEFTVVETEILGKFGVRTPGGLFCTVELERLIDFIPDWTPEWEAAVRLGALDVR